MHTYFAQHIKVKTLPARASGKMQLRKLSTYLSSLVGQQGVLCCLLAVSQSLELSQVAVVVTLHLEVKHLGLATSGSGDQVLVQQLQNAVADLAQLLLHLRTYKTIQECRVCNPAHCCGPSKHTGAELTHVLPAKMAGEARAHAYRQCPAWSCSLNYT